MALKGDGAGGIPPVDEEADVVSFCFGSKQAIKISTSTLGRSDGLGGSGGRYCLVGQSNARCSGFKHNEHE